MLGTIINQVLCFDPSTNQWTAKANMPTARHGARLVWFENRIWALGGRCAYSQIKLKATTQFRYMANGSILMQLQNWPSHGLQMEEFMREEV